MLNLQRQAVPQLTSSIRKARTSNIAKVDFLHEDLSHELRNKFAAPPDYSCLQDLLSESKFQDRVGGSVDCALSNATREFYSLAIAVLLPAQLSTLVQHEYMVQILRNYTRVARALYRLPCHTFRLLHNGILDQAWRVSVSTVYRLGELLLALYVCDTNI